MEQVSKIHDPLLQPNKWMSARRKHFLVSVLIDIELE